MLTGKKQLQMLHQLHLYKEYFTIYIIHTYPISVQIDVTYNTLQYIGHKISHTTGLQLGYTNVHVHILAYS